MTMGKASKAVPEEHLAAVERQHIEYLRRLYAVATDQIGMGVDSELERGRETYRRIFTADARIRVISNGEVTHEGVGPDSWYAVVRQALQPYAGVQHLIGSQVVEFTDDRTDEATMSSYLQAWHDCPAEYVFTFIGTYYDRVRLVPGEGWKIYDMELREVSKARFYHDHLSL